MKIRKCIGVLLALAVAAACGVWLFQRVGMKPPKESKLIHNFRAHRTIYDRLRQMLLEDKQVRQVRAGFGIATGDSPLIREPSEVNFPITRYNEYVNLLRQIGSDAAFKSSGSEPELVCLGAWGAGWAGHSRHIWICSTPNPSIQVSSLDAYYLSPNRPHNVFRHIDDEWYLRADW